LSRARQVSCLPAGVFLARAARAGGAVWSVCGRGVRGGQSAGAGESGACPPTGYSPPTHAAPQSAQPQHDEVAHPSQKERPSQPMSAVQLGAQ